MNYIISQLWAAFNLYLTNRGIIPIPYPSIYIQDPIIQHQFAQFCSIFQSYPRQIQTYFLYNEERYARNPDIIPANPCTTPLQRSSTKIGLINTKTKINRSIQTPKSVCWLMARRASKTTYLNIRSVDLLQIPFGNEIYAQQIFYGTKDDADEFFPKLINQLKIDKIPAKATSTDGTIRSQNNQIEYRYLSSKGGNRGHKPISVAVDEVGFISNKQLELFLQAVEAAMRDNKANITFLTSPAESLENTFLTHLALNADLSVTLMLPAFFNNARNSEGHRINSSSNLISETQKLIKKNQKFMVKTTIFGIPLLQGGREIFIRPHFYVFNKRSFDPQQSPYAHIPDLDSLPEEDKIKLTITSDLRRQYGTAQSHLPQNQQSHRSILYSFLVSDLSYSGVGDYTVIFHVGVSASNDLYILNIFRKPTHASTIEQELISFLLDCLHTPHGESLKVMYIEGKDADAQVRIRTLKNMVDSYIKNQLEPTINQNPQTIITRKNCHIEAQTLKQRISKVVFGYINPKGGTFNEDKSAAQQLHGFSIQDVLFLKTSGSKIQRARTASSVLSRISHVTQEQVKIVFMCPYTDDHVIDDVLQEILSIEAKDLSDTDNKRKNRANSHDDAFDTLVYSLLVSEKINDAISRGFDIERGFQVLDAEKSLQSSITIKREIKNYEAKRKVHNQIIRKTINGQNQKKVPSIKMGSYRPYL